MRHLQQYFSWLARLTVLLYALVVMSPALALAATPGEIGAWQVSPQTLPAGISNAAAVAANGYLYVIGGGTDLGVSDTVHYAKQQTNGTIGAWQTASELLPFRVEDTAVAVYNNYIYAIGGFTGIDFTNTVMYAPLNGDGTTGAWQTSPELLPAGMQAATAIVDNGYLYLIGGFDGVSPTTDAVFVAQVNNDGTIGAWQTSPQTLPGPLQNATSTVYNGYVYVLGGLSYDMSFNQAYSNTIYYAKLNGNGTTGAWQMSPQTLPQPISLAASAAVGGYLYLVGGYNGTDPVDAVYYAKLNNDGAVGAWQTAPQALPHAFNSMASTVANGYVYLMGGDDGTALLNSVYYAALSSSSPPTSNLPQAPATGRGAPATSTLTGLAITIASGVPFVIGLLLAGRKLVTQQGL